MFSLLDSLVGRNLVVTVDRLRVKGTLVNYRHSQKTPHNPESLILRDEDNRFLILRDWDEIEVFT